jgi:hypothetical protein
MYDPPDIMQSRSALPLHQVLLRSSVLLAKICQEGNNADE